MHLHVDGDLIVYRAGFAAEKQQWHVMDEWGGICQTTTLKKDAEAACEELMEDAGPGFYTVEKGERMPEPVENAYWAAKMILQGVKRNLSGYDSMTVYLSGDDNFRLDVATMKVYKGNRDDKHRPVHAGDIKKYLEKNYEVIYSDGEEADDTIGWHHFRLWEEDPFCSVVVSIDKDLDMLPGLHYNFVKEESYIVQEDEAMYNFYAQMISGDTTDNIGGIPGLGVKKAATYLAEVEKTEAALHKAVFQLYEDAFGSEAVAAYREHGQLLWIRRHEDEMWKPYNERNEG